PSVNQRVLLPAADTQADPEYAGLSAYAQLKEHSPKRMKFKSSAQPASPIAASGAYEGEAMASSAAQAKKAAEHQPEKPYLAAKTEDDPHQYFDTAPIPGISAADDAIASPS